MLEWIQCIHERKEYLGLASTTKNTILDVQVPIVNLVMKKSKGLVLSLVKFIIFMLVFFKSFSIFPNFLKIPIDMTFIMAPPSTNTLLIGLPSMQAFTYKAFKCLSCQGFQTLSLSSDHPSQLAESPLLFPPCPWLRQPIWPPQLRHYLLAITTGHPLQQTQMAKFLQQLLGSFHLGHCQLRLADHHLSKFH